MIRYLRIWLLGSLQDAILLLHVRVQRHISHITGIQSRHAHAHLNHMLSVQGHNQVATKLMLM